MIGIVSTNYGVTFQAKMQIKKDVQTKLKKPLQEIDKQISDSAKNAIGATAVAELVASGIKATKEVKKTKVSKPKTPKSTTTKSTTTKSTTTESTTTESTTTETKTKITPESLGIGKLGEPTTSKPGVPSEFIGARFDTLEGLLQGNKDKKIRIDKDKNRIYEFYDYWNTVGLVSERDLKTKTQLKLTFYDRGDDRARAVHEADPETGYEVKITEFFHFMKDYVVSKIFDCNPETGNKVKITEFKKDGKTVDRVIDCDPETGKIIKYTYFDNDGKAIE